MQGIEAILRLVRLVFVTSVITAVYISVILDMGGFERTFFIWLFFVGLVVFLVVELFDFGQFIRRSSKPAKPPKH